MNKKLLICGAIATGLLLTACVKKEAPKEDQQTEVAPSEPIALQPLETQDTTIDSEVNIPEQVEVERVETEHTTTEIRRSVQNTEPAAVEVESAPTPKPAEPKPTVSQPSTPKVENNVAPAEPKKATSGSQSQDDAVAAAIAAATPALQN